MDSDAAALSNRSCDEEPDQPHRHSRPGAGQRAHRAHRSHRDPRERRSSSDRPDGQAGSRQSQRPGRGAGQRGGQRGELARAPRTAFCPTCMDSAPKATRAWRAPHTVTFDGLVESSRSLFRRRHRHGARASVPAQFSHRTRRRLLSGAYPQPAGASRLRHRPVADCGRPSSPIARISIRWKWMFETTW